MVSDLLAAERSSHKVGFKGNSFPFLELHLEQFISSSKGFRAGKDSANTLDSSGVYEASGQSFCC